MKNTQNMKNLQSRPRSPRGPRKKKIELFQGIANLPPETESTASNGPTTTPKTYHMKVSSWAHTNHKLEPLPQKNIKHPTNNYPTSPCSLLKPTQSLEPLPQQLLNKFLIKPMDRFKSNSTISPTNISAVPKLSALSPDLWNSIKLQDQFPFL